MNYKKFEKSDIFYNVLKTKPYFEVLLGKNKEIYNGVYNTYYNLNLGQDYYIYKIRNSDRYLFRDTNEYSYFNEKIVQRKYPFESNILIKYSDEYLNVNNIIDPIKLENDQFLSRKWIFALRNTLNRKIIKSNHYQFSSSLGDKSTQATKIVSIPSVFYGSSIQKGTVELGFYLTGALCATLKDTKLNGELIETTGLNTGSVAGVVLYEEGIIVLTGSWNLNNSFTDTYRYNDDGSGKTAENPKWIFWGSGLDCIEDSTKKCAQRTLNLTDDSYFSLKFNGINYVNTLTMFAHAEKGELNHSNNLTYIKYGELEKNLTLTGSNSYVQPDNLEIKNTVKYEYDNFSGSLEKQTFITKVGIYDNQKNLIAIAKVSKPIKKTENRNFTFKLKLDI